ncbi:hypothetical protein GDO81_019606 [Engystomops pustulosus]|uniref:EGF-like domain-containing protein n=1 Tax=Engystomops pustulosus TaxID=76066 RepID=A0AAV6ZP41_ENGPU|nr:hypothetical protein GDO81_019606 [Engystomops pustulosus]
MTSVAMTFLLWLAGHSCLWPLAHQAERDTGVTMENRRLISGDNLSLHDVNNSTIQWIDNQTTHPNPGGNKKVILKRVNKRRKSFRERIPNGRSNRCGEKCCPGWSTAPNTETCTRAICTPKCKNKGVCRKPQKCVCKMGFEGSQCEEKSHSQTSPMPSDDAQQQTPAELMCPHHTPIHLRPQDPRQLCAHPHICRPQDLRQLCAHQSAPSEHLRPTRPPPASVPPSAHLTSGTTRPPPLVHTLTSCRHTRPPPWRPSSKVSSPKTTHAPMASTSRRRTSVCHLTPKGQVLTIH